jgi:dimethylamine--corrinoid protein Co-methyltransferase
LADEKKFKTSMGDGFLVYMTEEEIRKDLAAGVEDAVKRGKVSPLTDDEMEHLYNIVIMPGKVVGVEPGREVVSTNDSGSYKISSKCLISIRRDEQAAIAERVLGCDSIDIGNTDYNYKTVKGIADREASTMRMALQKTTMPLFYGAMTNLGFYTKPDGPVENWAMLLPEGRIEEAMEAQEEAIEHAVRDIEFVAEQIYKAGGDGMNFDTTGAAGDADFLAALKATEVIKEKYPDLAIEIGMAGEFVLGMHGKLEYDGKRLAGMYVHDQVKAVEKAGASIFGAVVNTNCNKTFPWNIARVCTFIKACTDVAEIPVHANVGMGVCAIPMNEILHTDIVSKVDKALIEICNIDGL